MMRGAPCAALVILAAGAACAPGREATPGHFVVHLRTDAPVPGDESSGVVPLFDTVRFDLAVAGGLCAGCERDVALDAEKLRGDLSFTVRSVTGGPIVLRTRMFRAAAPPELAPRASIEVWTNLGQQPADGVRRDVTIALPVERVGHPAGSAEMPEEAPEASSPFVGRLSIWAPARRTPCAGSPSARDVCIPGGAFWMGSVDANPIFGMSEPRLVVIAPFFLDAREISVGEYRSTPNPEVSDVRVFSGKVTGDSFEDFCTFTKDAGPNDDYPVTCIGWASARAACRARGPDVDLPTEAQWEYAAGRLSSLPHVWGLDAPSCLDAVVDRSPQKSPFIVGGGGECRPARGPGVDARAAFGWPEPAVGATHGRDTLQLAGSPGIVFDLMGNVAEWVRDLYHQAAEPCWSDPGIRVDPVCAAPQSPERSTLRSVRGGAWLFAASQANTHLRSPIDGTTPTQDWPGIGFRCARAR